CMDYYRLRRGRSYSRPDRLVEFEIKSGVISATVRGNINPYFEVYTTPYYQAEIKLQQVQKKHWTRVLECLGGNANWVTHLILGEVPPTIENALEGANVGLLPRDSKEIKSKCSCPDWANPCKHVAGVYYHVAELLDHDPLLLFELRGLDRKKLMQAVSRSEFGMALGGGAPRAETDFEAVAKNSRFPEVASAPANADPSDMRAFWLGRVMPADLLKSGPPPPISILPMRRGGDYPEFWHDHRSFLETMSEAYERISKSVPGAKPSKGAELLRNR
ncbi:MAG: SWIM zinc finger family protein, partial [Albidovulum sp.]|nr:SWIM zinc finger family protein [Albidovulum sp.]